MPEELSNEPSWGTAPRKLGQDALIWRVEVREALREREKTETTRKQRHEPRESENRSERDRTKRARGCGNGAMESQRETCGWETGTK